MTALCPKAFRYAVTRANRGLAIFGSTLFQGTLDGHLIAIDANTGQVIWDTVVASPADGYTLTGAPLVVNNAVVVGEAGGDYGARGFLAAYDTATGKQRWRFQTIPGPGDPGHESWKGESWRDGGGATWTTGSYDPELDLIYWGVGNPSPEFSGDVRQGDNLFTYSVIALHATSGKLAWHFQFTPHDVHDWDAAQTPILADGSIADKPQKLICWFNKNGFYYVLDRISGKFLLGTPFANQNWAKELDRIWKAYSVQMKLQMPDYPRGRGLAGAVNWQPAALDQTRGLVFVHAIEGSSFYTKSYANRIRRRKGDFYLGSGAGEGIFDGSFVRALDITTGVGSGSTPHPNQIWTWISTKHSGLLATAGGLVFGASAGYLFALELDDGKRTLACIPGWRYTGTANLICNRRTPSHCRVGGSSIFCLRVVANSHPSHALIQSMIF